MLAADYLPKTVLAIADRTSVGGSGIHWHAEEKGGKLGLEWEVIAEEKYPGLVSPSELARWDVRFNFKERTVRPGPGAVPPRGQRSSWNCGSS